MLIQVTDLSLFAADLHGGKKTDPACNLMTNLLINILIYIEQSEKSVWNACESKQHRQNKHPVEFADIVRSEEQKNLKQSSIKDFTHCSLGSLALQNSQG